MIGAVLVVMCVIACLAVRKAPEIDIREDIASDARRNLADPSRWSWRS